MIVGYYILSCGTQPNLAYGAGSTWLQGANTDEEAGRDSAWIIKILVDCQFPYCMQIPGILLL